MGVFTDNMQQVNRTLQTQNEQKITQKEAKKNYETFIFFEIWQTFAQSQDIEKTYLYFKDTTTTKKYIEKHEHIKGNDGKYKILIDFNNLTITEKLKIYNNILDKIYKQFTYKIKNIDYNKPIEEAKKENTFLIGITKTINFIIYIFIGFIVSICFGKTPSNKKYKI